MVSLEIKIGGYNCLIYCVFGNGIWMNELGMGRGVMVSKRYPARHVFHNTETYKS